MEEKPKIKLNLVLASLLFVTTILMVASIQLWQDEIAAHDKTEMKLQNKIDERDIAIKNLLTNKEDWLTASDESSVAPVEELEGEWISLGQFKITYYGPDCFGCSGVTASGTVPTLNRTIATDPDVIPLGSEVMINGIVYIAEDTGGAIKGNVIDLFVESEAVSYELGIYYTEIYIKENK